MKKQGFQNTSKEIKQKSFVVNISINSQSESENSAPKYAKLTRGDTIYENSNDKILSNILNNKTLQLRRLQRPI